VRSHGPHAPRLPPQSLFPTPPFARCYRRATPASRTLKKPESNLINACHFQANVAPQAQNGCSLSPLSTGHGNTPRNSPNLARGYTPPLPALGDAAPHHTSTGRARGMTHTTLVVDDDPAQRRLMQAMAERAGFQTMTASSGKEALDILRGP